MNKLLENTEGKRIILFVREAQSNRYFTASDLVYPRNLDPDQQYTRRYVRSISEHGRLQTDECKKWIEILLSSIGRKNELTYSPENGCPYHTAAVLNYICPMKDEPSHVKFDELDERSTKNIDERVSFF